MFIVENLVVEGIVNTVEISLIAPLEMASIWHILVCFLPDLCICVCVCVVYKSILSLAMHFFCSWIKNILFIRGKSLSP